MRDFLEDLLDEDIRESIRAHLRQCPRCRSYAARIGSFANDLKRLASKRIPSEMVEAILHGLSQKRSPRVAKPSSSFHLIFSLLGLLVIGALYFALFRLPAPMEPPRQRQPLTPEQQYYLKQLEKIDAHLEKVSKRMDRPEERKAEGPKVNIKPMHWQFQFQNRARRQAFIKGLDRFDINEDYASKDLTVFTMRRTQ